MTSLAQMLSLMNQEKKKAHENGTCIRCKEVAAPKIYSHAGTEEYRISGLCEECFDEITEERGEE